VQIIGTVLSADQENDPDILALVGASCALSISQIPFAGPVGAVRVARVNGSFVINRLTPNWMGAIWIWLWPAPRMP